MWREPWKHARYPQGPDGSPVASSQALGAERSIPHWLSLGLPQRVRDPKAPGPGPTPVNGLGEPHPGERGARVWGCFSLSCLCPTCPVGAGTSVGLWAAEGEAWVRRGRRGNGFQVGGAAQAGLEPLEVWELLKLSYNH